MISIYIKYNENILMRNSICEFIIFASRLVLKICIGGTRMGTFSHYCNLDISVTN
jgi:hypothetical protein